MNDLTDQLRILPRTVFLDRDGVINRKMPEGEYVSSWDKFHLLPGVVEAIARLNGAGIRVIVITNQRGIALRLYRPEDLDYIHARLQESLSGHGAHIDAFFFCPHDRQACECRKPLPGLFRQAQVDFPDVDSETSLMIGDSLSDIEFGRNLGMKTIFIEGQSTARQDQKPGASRAADLADECFETLLDAVNSLLGHASVK